jgi:hypothetical protein
MLEFLVPNVGDGVGEQVPGWDFFSWIGFNEGSFLVSCRQREGCTCNNALVFTKILICLMQECIKCLLSISLGIAIEIFILENSKKCDEINTSSS